MEFCYELLLTALFSLLAAFLLGKLFGPNDPGRPGPDRWTEPAGAPAGVEEEKIIEVDAVAVKGERADVATLATAESWVEEEKAPAVVVEEKAECLVEEEGVPAKAAWGEVLDVGLEEQKAGVVGEDQGGRGEVINVGLEEERLRAVEFKAHDLSAESAPREVLAVGLEEKVQAVEVQHAEAAPSEALDVRLENEDVQVVDVKQNDLVAETAPREVLNVRLEEDRVQVMEMKPHELAAEAAPREAIDLGLDKDRVQAIKVKQHDLAADSTSREVHDVELEEEKELLEQPVKEDASVPEEVESNEGATCGVHLINQTEELVAKEDELAVKKKADEVNICHGGDYDDKRIAQSEKEGALQEVHEEDVGVDMEFGEWEGVERSEVEKRFGAAATFVTSEFGAAALSKLSSNVQLQLQGLLKVAVDGPCYDSAQPLSLRPSSRAKWAAWQKLGNMNPEFAMEQYMTLLSENIPGWMGEKALDIKKHEASDFEGPVLTMPVHASNRQASEGGGDSASMEEGRLTSLSNPDKGLKFGIPTE